MRDGDLVRFQAKKFNEGGFNEELRFGERTRIGEVPN
jgi:hypothetical protein